MKTEGGILVLMIPVAFLLISLVLFLAHQGGAMYQGEKIQVTAESTLLSVLRLRVEALESLPDRIHKLKPLIHFGDASGAHLFSSSTGEIRAIGASIKKSIPGYQGRLSSVATVVLTANGSGREFLSVIRKGAAELGVKSEGQWVHPRNGSPQWVEGVWLRRIWSIDEEGGHPIETAVYQLKARDSLGRWVKRQAQGGLQWDVNHGDSIVRQSGNGGYPSEWSGAIEGNSFNPHRVPLYRAELRTVSVEDHQIE